MKKALALLVIALAAPEASGESYRPLPRLPAAKVKARAAETGKVPIPPATATATARATPTATGAPAVRRARRIGPPPPLQDEAGRTIVFASAPPLQDEAGQLLLRDEPVHVVNQPARGTRARGAMK